MFPDERKSKSAE